MKNLDFEEQYKLKGIDLVKNLESIRISEIIAFLLIIFTIFLVYIFVAYFPKAGNIFFLIFLFVLFGLSFFLKNGEILAPGGEWHLVRNYYKNDLLKKILPELFDQFEYNPKYRISPKAVDRSLIFERFYYFEGEDYMKFNVADAFVMFSEIKLKGNLKGQTNLLQKWRGVFLCTTFPKSFLKRTVIVSKKQKGIFNTLNFNQEGLVLLEDPLFSKEWKVFSEDQVEARYLLSTSLMERVRLYQKKLQYPMTFSFVGNIMYCFIQTKKDLFEPSLFKPINYELVKSHYETIALFSDIVEDLNLNQRIWG